MLTMTTASPLSPLLESGATIEKKGINVAQSIADKTVWDTLATKNPTHAVISAKDEADAALKSKAQIEDIARYVTADTVLLDLGCGYGRVAKYLLPKQSLKGYIGVDSSFEMLTLFKQRYDYADAERTTPVLFVNADINALPLKNATVDVVVVCAVFLHNHKDIVARSLEEVRRVLKPDGTLVVYSSFPRAITAMGFQGWCYQMLLNVLGRPYKNGPVRYYRKGEIARLLGGFAEVDILPVGYSFFPKTLIFLPRPLEVLYRVGIANPLNRLCERITPTNLRPFFAVHYDVVAKLKK